MATTSSPEAEPAPARPGGADPARPRRRLTLETLGGRRPILLFLLGAVVIVIVAAVGSSYIQNHPDRLDYATRAYQILPREARLTFDVEKSPSAVAQCTVSALARDNEVVGQRSDIVVGPTTDGRKVTTVTVSVPTSREATAVEVEDCEIVRPG
jgi:hypothetical protein